MTAPRADQLLDALGDATIRDVMRCLLVAPATQADLVRERVGSQGNLSRVVAVLRALDLLEESGSGRSVLLSIGPRDEAIGLLMAADRLAEATLAAAQAAQESRSTDTRRRAIREATSESATQNE
jgi:DNA-binding transcriptional ArsR family regulator